MTVDTGTKRKADLKVVLLGEASVGKTTLVCRYIDGVFQETISTIGASFSLKQWGPYNVAIWDTAGEERFSGLSSFYCRGAAAAILAFDLSSQVSFEALSIRFLPLLENVEEDCFKVVVGTKLDAATKETREVATEEARQFARTINNLSPKSSYVPYFETSSKTGVNVNAVFQCVFDKLLPLDGSGQKDEGGKKVGIDLSKTKMTYEGGSNKCCVIS